MVRKVVKWLGYIRRDNPFLFVIVLFFMCIGLLGFIQGFLQGTLGISSEVYWGYYRSLLQNFLGIFGLDL